MRYSFDFKGGDEASKKIIGAYGEILNGMNIKPV
jgi:hypothetical protein